MRIAVLSTGVGNVQSVLKALARAREGDVPGSDGLGVPRVPPRFGSLKGLDGIEATRDPDVVRRADAIVVPGQGSFGVFARSLRGGLDDAIRERIAAGVPYLGICLGLQILFESSEESALDNLGPDGDGDVPGLGIFRGVVRRMKPGVEQGADGVSRTRPLPHVGWNRVTRAPDSGRVVPEEHYYFAHSYAAVPADPSIIVATTSYGETFPSVIGKDNVFGVQFHPEKSQRAGLALLADFFRTT